MLSALRLLAKSIYHYDLPFVEDPIHWMGLPSSAECLRQAYLGLQTGFALRYHATDIELLLIFDEVITKADVIGIEALSALILMASPL